MFRSKRASNRNGQGESHEWNMSPNKLNEEFLFESSPIRVDIVAARSSLWQVGHVGLRVKWKESLLLHFIPSFWFAHKSCCCLLPSRLFLIFFVYLLKPERFYVNKNRCDSQCKLLHPQQFSRSYMLMWASSLIFQFTSTACCAPTYDAYGTYDTQTQIDSD